MTYLIESSQDLNCVDKPWTLMERATTLLAGIIRPTISQLVMTNEHFIVGASINIPQRQSINVSPILRRTALLSL